MEVMEGDDFHSDYNGTSLSTSGDEELRIEELDYSLLDRLWTRDSVGGRQARGSSRWEA
jgi:hypothetical protein